MPQRLFLLLVLAGAAALAQPGYFQFSVDQDRLAGAPDFSRLNHPLGPADRLFVRGAHFYRVGDDLEPFTSDDERVRLFGINLVFGGCFPEPGDAARIARRLRKMGVNLVRLHHMDTSPDEEPERARSILTTGPYPTLNPVSVKRLRRFLDALAAEGIYVNLNLHVGYRFRPFVDGVPAMPGGREIPRQSKPLHIFFPRMVELQKQYARKVIRALELKGKPALAMVEINNESSLLFSWQAGRMEAAVAGAYRTELRKQWNAWLRERYGSTEALCRSWKRCPAGAAIENGNVPLVGSGERDDPARTNDFIRFLEDADRRYLKEMLEVVRAETDALVPVAGTQLRFGGPLNFDTHAILDYQDNHFYIDHYNFPNRRWDPRDWRIRDSSSVGTGLERFLETALYRESGRPYTVSEYNQPYPNRQAAEIDATLAAFGAFQDWDSIMHFAYAHDRNWDAPVPSSFDINGDWTKYALIAQSAWLFRSGVIRPGEALVEVPLSRERKMAATRQRRSRNLAEYLAKTASYEPAVALLHRVAVVNESARPLPEAARRRLASPLRSDTAQLTYDREARIFKIHAERAAGVFGFTGTGRAVAAGALAVELAPSARGFAAVLVTSLDGKPIEDSRRLLLSTPGYVIGSRVGPGPARPLRLVHYEGDPAWWTIEPDPAYPGKPSGSRRAEPPVWMERVESYVTLRSRARRLAVYPLDGAGTRLAPLESRFVERLDGGYRIHLQADGQDFSPWYEIVAE